MLSYRTAGESHGAALYAMIEGLPAGLAVDPAVIEAALARRRGGAGRSSRQEIELDGVTIAAGLKGGTTLGSPLMIQIANRDAGIDRIGPISTPRPGHADLAGMLKYGVADASRVLERASARETAARTAAGSVAAILLAQFNIEMFAHVVQIGPVSAAAANPSTLVSLDLADCRKRRDASRFWCLDPACEAEMLMVLEEAARRGDTVGGIFVVQSTALPPGLGSNASWDQRLDGRLASAVSSIPGIKGVEFGLGFAYAAVSGREAHDVPRYLEGVFKHATNRAGGLEGGMTNGEPLYLRAVMKPLATLSTPIETVDLASKGRAIAPRLRSDILAVPAASVVAEAVVAFEIAGAMREKFGGDSLAEMKRNYDGYLRQISRL